MAQMVVATYSIVRATLNSEEVDQQCVARCVSTEAVLFSFVRVVCC